MSNRLTECFLKTGLPKRPDGNSYSSTAYAIYLTICYRYDEKKGYSYPGEKQLMVACGKSRQSVNNGLTELLEGKVITKWKKGYRGQRAEFIPVYHLSILNSVKVALPNSIEKATTFNTESDNLNIKKSKDSKAKETSQPVAISILSSSKSSNENLEELLNFIPITRRPLPLSKEVTNLLKDLRHKGTSSKAIEDHFYETNWQEINNSNAFVIDRLKNLNARPVKYSKEFPPPYCGECDEIERAQIITDENGEHFISCKECNWFWVNKKNGY